MAMPHGGVGVVGAGPGDADSGYDILRASWRAMLETGSGLGRDAGDVDGGFGGVGGERDGCAESGGENLHLGRELRAEA